jgi:hypothetical protein
LDAPAAISSFVDSMTPEGAPKIASKTDIPTISTGSIPGHDFSALDFTSFPGLDFSTILDFSSLDDGADDGDFIPETSPKRHSDSEESEDEDQTPSASRRKPKGKGRPYVADEEDEDDEEDDFVDEEVEDEDLFLPIEDVPVPPVQHSAPGNGHDGQEIRDWTGDMMKALKVDTRDQLAAVMQKLVDSAGEGGVQPEVMEKLKSVIHLAKA